MDLRREDREYLKKIKADRQALKENAIAKEKEDYNNRIANYEDERDLREAAIENFYDYKDNVRKTLLKKALYEIYTGSFHNITDREKVICDNLLEQYIDEAGTAKLLRNMRVSNSYTLHNIEEEVVNTANDITKDATAADPDTQTIDGGDVNNFWDRIDKSDNIEDITNMIRLRVSNAEEEFVNKNQEDKEDVRTILKNTATRIKNAQGTNDNDYSEAVEESESRIAKEQIYNIQHGGHRNVFDRMVRNLSEAVLTNGDDAAKEAFTEDGHLDMDKIVESVRCMYTLLEMVGTIQLEKVDQEYIENTINSIK